MVNVARLGAQTPQHKPLGTRSTKYVIATVSMSHRAFLCCLIVSKWLHCLEYLLTTFFSKRFSIKFLIYCDRGISQPALSQLGLDLLLWINCNAKPRGVLYLWNSCHGRVVWGYMTSIRQIPGSRVCNLALGRLQSKTVDI